MINQIKLFTEEMYTCKTKELPVLFTKQKINCKHWSASDDCTVICSLNVINNPNSTDCAKCEKREAINNIIENYPKPKLIASFTQPQNQVPEKKSFLEKAVSYGKAEISQFVSGKVSDEIYNKRKEICLSCDYKVNPAPHSEPIGWCKGGCGCKIGNPRASLSQKLYMPSITCPLKKFGPEQGQGFNVGDAIDSVKGAATAVTETLKSDTEENK